MSQFLSYLKSLFHTCLQNQMKCKQRGMDLILKELCEDIHVSHFWQTSCVRWLWNIKKKKKKKKKKHLCGFQQIMQSTSALSRHFSSYHLRANHILSKDFPANFFNPPQLIASRLQSPIILSIPSALISSVFKFMLRCTLQ